MKVIQSTYGFGVSLAVVAVGVSASAQVQVDGSEMDWRTEVVPTLDIGPGVVTGVEIRSRLVTAEGLGTRTTTPGSQAFGLNVDGVAELFLDNNPNPGFGGICTGSLLSTGQHILTAAHCVTDPSGNINLLDGGDGNTATFDLPGGAGFVDFNSTDVLVHPNWDGTEVSGFDVAIIDLGTPLIPEVPRYDLISSAPGSDFDTTVIKVGYGRSGNGATGDTLNAGTKRAGLNTYESNGFGFLGGVDDVETQLVYDFDNGEADNDGFGFFFGDDGLLAQNPIFDDAVGQGLDEVGTAPGDSGGPGFIFNPLSNAWEIAGVTSYGLIFEVSPDGISPPVSSDILPGLNSSFGEFAGDARIADPEILNWINSVIPEPGTGTLVLGLAALGMTRRRSAA